ncbi:response regulator [Paenibacillus sp. ATY16]|uniref:response regulator n=1 Tax=Paenibacillus sp. ATY16 TaxID=1759312 RepID=UPI00200F550D|nr:response regulator [Paenibacillus sp. ATY16]MCK9860341.1 response regulator [Paenibacillus sp. ATY16]
MIRAIIVDDEEWTRMSLRKQADWEMLGIELAGEARNGAAAMELVRERKPHLVITDIRMPAMDGIRLMELLHAEYPEVLIIVISGYSDFEYARKALSFGAFEYILKPIETEPLMQALQRAADKLRHERERQAGYVDLFRKANLSDLLSKEKVLTRLVTSAASDSGEIENALRRHGLLLDWPRTAVLTIEVANFEKVAAERYKQDKDLAHFVLANVIGELFRKYPMTILFRNIGKDNELVLLKGLSEEEDQKNISSLYEDCRLIIDTVKQATQFELNIGIGRECTDLADIYRSYAQACEAVQNAELVLASQVTHFDEVSSRNEYYIYPNDKEKALLYYVGNLYKGQAVALVAELFGEMKKNAALHPQSIRSTALGLIFAINQALSPYQSSINELGIGEAENAVRSTRLTVDELSTDVQRIVEAAVDYLSSRKKSGSYRGVEEIVEYLGAHFHEEITLGSVAERYFLNPAYLSRIFKNETGQTFNDYVNTLRLEAASKLLKDPKLKMSAISEMAGYMSEKYFFRKFKEHYGCTPTEYRNR